MFYKPEDEVFDIGERWCASGDPTGKGVIILGVSRFNEGMYDVSVYYKEEGQNYVYEKDAWNFQVRYFHSSDRVNK